MHRNFYEKMISRRYLRIKVMQAIYAKQANAKEDLVTGEKNLNASIQNCEVLSYHFFSVFPEIKRYLEDKFEECKAKNYPTYEDLHPNTKFADNLVIKQMEESSYFRTKWESLKVDWSMYPELISQLFQKISELPEYQEYMNTPERDYRSDKDLVLLIIEKVFAESELLHWCFEEKFVHWFDDYNDALLQVYQTITFWRESAANVEGIKLFKDPVEDKEFYQNLYRKTILNDGKYHQLIEEKLHNWESERIIETDMILMKMAVCELLEFPNIPTKVTINEYIEIAKVYGSDKSATFINGMIDRIAADLREDGALNKSGRGLLDRSCK